IGGTVPDPREAGLGGFLGGLLFSVLLLMNCVTLYLSSAQTEGAEGPMLKIFDSIHPVASLLTVIVVFLKVYNTALGTFYALARAPPARRGDVRRACQPLKLSRAGDGIRRDGDDPDREHPVAEGARHDRGGERSTLRHGGRAYAAHRSRGALPPPARGDAARR